MLRGLMSCVLLSAAVGLAADGGVPEGASARAAIVRFHTSCVACHAAECSGRLSFDSGNAGARGHVKRYAPTADDVVVRELFSLLTTLKRTCRHELPTAPSPQRYDPALLREHFNPDAAAWFLPLGVHTRPTSVEVDVGVGEHAEVMLLDEGLETLAEVHGEGRLQLTAPASKARTFLLVRRAKSLSMVELR